MARYYALSIQPTLFGEITLIRAWGQWRSCAKLPASGYVPKASRGNLGYGIECRALGTEIDEPRLAATRSQAD
ncbi:hypothetical protein GFB56_35730 [Ensifer sp. T173]|uniref:WGR domain-containing protein n=1 Tax=Ensifer canadensis TaxID=555315 RepID=A0AAW4FXL3_9HYPH|nr:hypothetical protein [Ensifer canadensis]UBI79976.1 WGR domain-containing protein [Ensifer canadensis]